VLCQWEHSVEFVLLTYSSKLTGLTVIENRHFCILSENMSALIASTALALGSDISCSSF